MRLNEFFDLFGKSDKKSAEEKALALKAKGMYTKSVSNLEAVMDQNAQAFH